ncbi:MAG: sialate O-acetylesterase [Fibrobacterota bacterium]
MKCFALFILVLFSFSLYAQIATLDSVPLQLQLFQRGADDSACLPIVGAVTAVGYDSLIVEITRNGTPFKRIATALSYSAGSARFSLHPAIHAELAEYTLRLFADADSVYRADSVVCGDAYLITGQSNAVSNDYDDSVSFQFEYVRSFRRGANIGWGLARADSMYLDYSVGVWGLWLGKTVTDSQGVPAAIINGALGSTEIESHLRYGPSPYNTYHLYGALMTRARNAWFQERVRAIFWHQGESDALSMALGAAYAGKFDSLYRSWKEDYPALQRIYVYQTHPGSSCGNYGHPVREAQRAFQETYPDVRVMTTADVRNHDGGCHYHYYGYREFARRMYDLLKHDFTSSIDTVGVSPPNIQHAYFTNSNRDEVALVFDQPVVWKADTFTVWNTTITYYRMKNYFYLEDTTAMGINDEVDSGYAVPTENKIILKLSRPTTATKITYLPHSSYIAGPWLRNGRGIGALTFYRFPVDTSSTITESIIGLDNPGVIRLSVSPNPANPRFRIFTSGLSATAAIFSKLRLDVIDAAGRRVADMALSPAELRCGVVWDAGRLPSGVYIVRLTIGNRKYETRAVLLK